MTEEDEVRKYWEKVKQRDHAWYNRGMVQYPEPSYKLINEKLHEEIYQMTKLLREIKEDMLGFTDGYVIINKIDEFLK